MGCNCGKKRTTTTVANAATHGLKSAPADAPRMGDPVVAAATGRYEVRTSTGSSSGRTFSSLDAANSFAARIRGTVVTL